MDNLCHTLAGLALGEAGLKRRSPLATATLVIGANLPDVDVLSYAVSPVAALGFRRGWTHGILAMVLWPLLLTAIMLVIQRRKPGAGAPPVGAPGLLVVASIAVWSHPLLDLLNTYGVRLLMPFSGRWFYGDTLFIADPWMWSALLLGVIASRYRPLVPARIALAACLLYVGFMAARSMAAASAARSSTLSDRGLAPGRVMAYPVFGHPLRRATVVEVPGGYLVDGAFIPRNDRLAAKAAATPEGRVWLTWARFPFVVVPPAPGCPPGHRCLRDARYHGQSWAELNIRMTDDR